MRAVARLRLALSLAGLSLAACATPPAPEAKSFAGDFSARGTEPFWALDIRSETLTLQRPDHAPLTARNPGRKVEGNRATWSTTLMTVTLADAGPCSDGMSDLTYRYTALVAIGGETLRGCALAGAKQ